MMRANDDFQFDSALYSIKNKIRETQIMSTENNFLSFIVRWTGSELVSITQDMNGIIDNDLGIRYMILKTDLDFHSLTCQNLIYHENQKLTFKTYRANNFSEHRAEVFEVLPHVKYSTSLEMYNKSFKVSDYQLYDLTRAIWPRHSVEDTECAFPLPEFVLESSYPY